MDYKFYSSLVSQSLDTGTLTLEVGREVLLSPEVRLPALLDAAFQIRQKYYGREVLVHILNNVQNGNCPEDCKYCAQSTRMPAPIEEYPLKSDAEILAEAEQAYRSGAFRYCMVFAGRAPSVSRIKHLSVLIREIKDRYPLEVCVSAGVLDREKALMIKTAGADRINHNLNTSRRFYPRVCTTHSYEQRLQTLETAREAGLQICSGLIVGMGEEAGDILDVAQTLSRYKVESIPVNFFIPVNPSGLGVDPRITPDYCLRVLCLFRLMNPAADIRVAAGRELYLKELEPLALYPANSLFLSGYLNVKGARPEATLQMIRNAGFVIRSEFSLDDLLSPAGSLDPHSGQSWKWKDRADLRPGLKQQG